MKDKMQFIGAFGDKAVEALEKADEWANKEGVMPETRVRMTKLHTDRALVLSILAVAEELSISTRHA